MLTLSNDNLILAVRSLVKEERRITRELLDHIGEVARRRLYADLGFASVFDWLVKDLGYSESAAYRRMQAARILQAVPEVAGKIESGKLALTVLSKVQTLIRTRRETYGRKNFGSGKVRHSGKSRVMFRPRGRISTGLVLSRSGCRLSERKSSRGRRGSSQRACDFHSRAI